MKLRFGRESLGRGSIKLVRGVWKKHDDILLNEPLRWRENYSPNRTKCTGLYDEMYRLHGAWDDRIDDMNVLILPGELEEAQLDS